MMGSHSKLCYFHYIKVNTDITIITRTGSPKSPQLMSPLWNADITKICLSIKDNNNLLHLYLVFPTNFRIVFLLHTNTAILLVLSQTLGHLWQK